MTDVPPEPTGKSPPLGVDRLFAEPRLAELYDLWHPWDQRGDFGFYLPLVLAAGFVLDVGCEPRSPRSPRR